MSEPVRPVAELAAVTIDGPDAGELARFYMDALGAVYEGERRGWHYARLPHLTSPHLTSPHLTSPHLTSPHLTSPSASSPSKASSRPRGVSMAAPKKYPDELRARAVRLYRTSSPRPTFRALAEQVGVYHEALRNWVRQAEADAGERDDPPTTAESEELVRLRKENAELRAGQRNPEGGERFFAQGIDSTRRRS